MMGSRGLIISGGAIIYVPIYKQKKIKKKKLVRMVLMVQRQGRKTSIQVIKRNLTIVETSTTTQESFIFSSQREYELFGYSNCLFLGLCPLHPILLPFTTALQVISLNS